MDRLAAEMTLEKAKMATAAAAARAPQGDFQNPAWQFDNPNMEAEVETLQAKLREMESDLMIRGIKNEDAVDHPATSYQAKLSLAATLEQTIKDHRDIVEQEVTDHGAYLDDELADRMVEMSNQAASMQEIANTAQDFVFYFQNIWLLCLMRLMCLM